MARRPKVRPGAGIALREVRRSHQSGLLRDVFKNLFAVPDVISTRYDFNARREQLLGNPGRNAKARGGILAVGDHQVDLARVHNVRQPVGYNLPARRTHDVTNKKNFHLLSLPTMSGTGFSLWKLDQASTILLATIPHRLKPAPLAACVIRKMR